MKKRVSVTIEMWVIDELRRMFPEARSNFSRFLSRVAIYYARNPQKYYKQKAKYKLIEFNSCLEILNQLDGKEREKLPTQALLRVTEQ